MSNGNQPPPGGPARPPEQPGPGTSGTADAARAAAEVSAQKAREAVDTAAEQLQGDLGGGGPAAAEGDPELERLRELASDESVLAEAEIRARRYVRRHPLRSAGLAFAAGYLIAALRRS